MVLVVMVLAELGLGLGWGWSGLGWAGLGSVTKCANALNHPPRVSRRPMWDAPWHALTFQNHVKPRGPHGRRGVGRKLDHLTLGHPCDGRNVLAHLHHECADECANECVSV